MRGLQQLSTNTQSTEKLLRVRKRWHALKSAGADPNSAHHVRQSHSSSEHFFQLPRRRPLLLSNGSDQPYPALYHEDIESKAVLIRSRESGTECTSKLLSLIFFLILYRLYPSFNANRRHSKLQPAFGANRSHRSHHRWTPNEATSKERPTNLLGALCTSTGFSQVFQIVAMDHDPEQAATSLWKGGLIPQRRVQFQRTWGPTSIDTMSSHL